MKFALSPLKFTISDPQPPTQSDVVPVIQHKTLDIVNITVEKDANENILNNSNEPKEEDNKSDSPNFRLAQEVESKSNPANSESTSLLESEEHEGRPFLRCKKLKKLLCPEIQKLPIHFQEIKWTRKYLMRLQMKKMMKLKRH